ncbi:MAG: hypothetical protein Fur0018_11040 [Anaerolineales bacterium]
MHLLSAFIPIDRRQTLFRKQTLPIHSQGATLLVDMAGFTLLCSRLIEHYGHEKGAEEITRLLSLVFTQLIAEIHNRHGSVIGFSGDALTCWFAGDDGRYAADCGLAMQTAIAANHGLRLPNGDIYPLAIKVAIASGAVSRLLVGDPAMHYLELLVGEPVEVMGRMMRHTRAGEVLISSSTAANLGADVEISAWREIPEDGSRVAILQKLNNAPRPHRWDATLPFFRDEVVKPWLLPTVYERLQTKSEYALAELRPVTSVFVGLGKPKIADDDYAWLGGYVRWVQSITHRYDGTLLNIHNDDKGLHMHLTFGAPVAHRDDVLRALNMAYALLESPAIYPVQARIGIVSGRVYAGVYGSISRQTYDVLGNSINLAAYLMSIAAPGEILCNHYTQQTAADTWRFEALPAIQVKGYAEPIPVYRPLLAHPAENNAAPFALVGRAQELQFLNDDFDLARAQKSAILTIIEGEAGIGKTRLLHAWLDQVETSQAVLLWGSGQSIETQTPYRAWRDVLVSAFQLPEGRSIAEREKRVRTFVETHIPEQAPRLPLLNNLLGLALPENELTSAFSPALRQQNLVLLVSALLAHLGNEKAVILIFDDAHWMDTRSWELLQNTLNHLRPQKRALHLVVALRPPDMNSLLQSHYQALRTHSNTRQVKLRSLPPHALRVLIGHRLKVPAEVLPNSLIRLVQRRTEGNPFYVDELLHTLQNKRILWVEQTFRGPRCILSADFERDSQTIPPTLEGLLLARIDSLPPERQLVLKVASVIGRTFLYSLLYDTLQQILPAVLANLKQELVSLQEQDLMHIESNEPNLAYVFKHIITQETAYQTLLFSQRRQLHQLVAEWYERHFPVYGDESAEHALVLPLLVHHYHYAEAPEKERDYTRLAGIQALNQHAHNEALAYFRRCLELTSPTDTSTRLEILQGLEEAYHWLGNRPAQKNILQEMETTAALLQHVHWQARVALRQARYARVTGKITDVIQAAQQVFALFPQLGYHEYKAEAHYEWGNALWQQGKYDEAMQHLDEALKMSELQRNSPIHVQVLKGMGAIYNERGQNREARLCYEQALQVARRIGDRHGEAAALGNLGNIASDLGDQIKARDFYLQALTIYRELAEWRAEAMVLNNLGALAYYLGSYDSAQDFYEQSLHIKWKIEDAAGEGMTYANLSGLLYATGDYGNALAYNDKALDILRTNQVLFWETLALQWRGDILLAQQNWAQAAEAYQQAITLRLTMGHQGLLLESQSGLAAALLKQGARDKAGELARQVVQALSSPTALEGATDPLRVYLRLMMVFKALDAPLANTLLQRAVEEIERRSAQISTVEDRERFRQAVPEHRTLLALHAQAHEMKDTLTR